MSIEVGPIRDPLELVPLVELLAHSFAADHHDVGRWLDRAGHDELRVAREGEDIVGGLIRIPMGQSFGGRFVPMCGIAGVGIRADKRRQGLASELMRQGLLELWEAGVALSTLYASNQPLYRSVGYEQAGAHWEGTLAPRDIGVREDGGRLTMATDADHAELEKLYRTHAQNRPGHLDRGPYQWSRLRAPSDGGAVHTALIRDEKDRLEAYVRYRQHRRPDGFLTLQVTDTASRTSRGWRRIWSHLGDLSTMVREISLSTSPTDPLYVLLPHPYMKLVLKEPWMLRVIDPSAALEARGYPKGQPERVVLKVVDPLLGDQTLTMDVEGGRARITQGGDPTAKVHIRGLSAMYTGYLSPYEVASIGLVEAGQRTLGALQALFAGPAPWMRDFF